MTRSKERGAKSETARDLPSSRPSPFALGPSVLWRQSYAERQWHQGRRGMARRTDICRAPKCHKREYRRQDHERLSLARIGAVEHLPAHRQIEHQSRQNAGEHPVHPPSEHVDPPCRRRHAQHTQETRQHHTGPGHCIAQRVHRKNARRFVVHGRAVDGLPMRPHPPHVVPDPFVHPHVPGEGDQHQSPARLRQEQQHQQPSETRGFHNFGHFRKGNSNHKDHKEQQIPGDGRNCTHLRHKRQSPVLQRSFPL